MLIEIEVDGASNRGLYFAPLGRRLRGRFDFNRDSEPMARVCGAEWPLGGVPGQVLGFDTAEGRAYVRDPAHESRGLSERLVQRRLRVGEKQEPVAGADAPTWLFWMRRAVESGAARLVQGSFPPDVAGRPRVDFALSHQVDAQSARVDRLLELLCEALKLSETQRKRLLASEQESRP